MGFREQLATRRAARHQELRESEAAGGMDTGSATVNTLAYLSVVAQDTVAAARETIAEIDARKGVIVVAGAAAIAAGTAFAVETARMVREHDLTDRSGE